MLFFCVLPLSFFLSTEHNPLSFVIEVSLKPMLEHFTLIGSYSGEKIVCLASL
jgi:hypothetical protein